MFYDFIYLAKGFRMRPKVGSTLSDIEKGKWKVHGVSQLQSTADRHQEEEEKTKTQRMQDKHANTREAYRSALSSPSEMITMLN